MQWPFILFAVAMVGVAGYAFYCWSTVERSIEISKPLIANTKIYGQEPANPSRRILIAGDSIGVGVGAADKTSSLAGRIGRDFPNAAIKNIAVSGAKLADLETKLSAVSSDGEFDLIFITIGGNDITGGTKFADVQTVLNRNLTRAEKLGKKVIVLTAGNVGLSPAFKWPLSSYITYRTREVRKIFIGEIAKYEDTAYVDLFQERKDETLNTDIPRYYASDLFHPSGDGYGLWYEKIKPMLVSVL